MVQNEEAWWVDEGQIHTVAHAVVIVGGGGGRGREDFLPPSVLWGQTGRWGYPGLRHSRRPWPGRSQTQLSSAQAVAPSLSLLCRHSFRPIR